MIKNEVVRELVYFLGMELKDIESVNNDDNIITFEDGRKYLVINEDERRDYVKEDIESAIDECGINAFGKDFQEYVKDNFIDVDYLEYLLRDDIENYINDLYRCEEFDDIKDLCETYGVEFNEEDPSDLIETYCDNKDAIEYFQAMGELDNLINNDFYDTIDMEELIDECIKLDGYGHFLSPYGGVEDIEIELSDNMYAYRIN